MGATRAEGVTFGAMGAVGAMSAAGGMAAEGAMKAGVAWKAGKAVEAEGGPGPETGGPKLPAAAIAARLFGPAALCLSCAAGAGVCAGTGTCDIAGRLLDSRVLC